MYTNSFNFLKFNRNFPGKAAANNHEVKVSLKSMFAWLNRPIGKCFSLPLNFHLIRYITWPRCTSSFI